MTNQYSISALGNLGWDEQVRVSELVNDGRVDIIEDLPTRPSGLGANGLPAAQSLLPGSTVALGGLVGVMGDKQLQAELLRLGVDVSYVFTGTTGATRRQRVMLAQDGKRLIIRMPSGVTMDAGRTLRHERRWKGMLARSKAAVLAHMPVDLTDELLEWCGRMGTFCALVPGRQQFSELANLSPDLLVQNVDEAAEATRTGDTGDPHSLFGCLLSMTSARFVVMTGGGSNPTFFADRRAGTRGKAESADVSKIACAIPYGLGAGDVFSCVLTRCLSLGQTIGVAVCWARLYATAHVCGVSFRTRREAEEWAALNACAFTTIETVTVPRVAA